MEGLSRLIGNELEAIQDSTVEHTELAAGAVERRVGTKQRPTVGRVLLGGVADAAPVEWHVALVLGHARRPAAESRDDEAGGALVARQHNAVGLGRLASGGP